MYVTVQVNNRISSLRTRCLTGLQPKKPYLRLAYERKRLKWAKVMDTGWKMTESML